MTGWEGGIGNKAQLRPAKLGLSLAIMGGCGTLESTLTWVKIKFKLICFCFYVWLNKLDLVGLDGLVGLIWFGQFELSLKFRTYSYSKSSSYFRSTPYLMSFLGA